MDGHLQVIRIGLEFRSCQDSLPPHSSEKKERRKEEKEEKKKRIGRVRKISLPGRIDV